DSTAQAAGSDCGARRKFLEFWSVRDECVPRDFPWRNGRNREPARQLKGDILQAMRCEIDAPVEQRFIEFLREESFAANLRKRGVENAVARCLDGNQFGGDAGLTSDLILDPVGLPERQRASARSETQGFGIAAHEIYSGLILKSLRTSSTELPPS